MNPTFESVSLDFTVTALPWTGTAQENQGNDAHKAEAGTVTSHSRGLHGYIGYNATRPPARSEYSAGMTRGCSRRGRPRGDGAPDAGVQTGFTWRTV